MINKFRVNRKRLYRTVLYMLNEPMESDRLPINLHCTLENVMLHDRYGNEIGVFDVEVMNNKERPARRYDPRQGRYIDVVHHDNKHRLLVQCKCGKQVSAGRLAQHATACEKLNG